MKKILLLLLLLSSFIYANPAKTITFESLDGLSITADIYGDLSNKNPLIILFHQAGWSRGEYQEIAPNLVTLGFNCIAIDQRSGGEVNGVINETKTRAEKLEKATQYLDALQDMEAAFTYVRDTLGATKIIIWGSSYSSAFCFLITSKYQNDVLAMLAFAPGEYFTRFGKSEDYIQSYAAKINIPVFITSAKDEFSNWKNIYESIPSNSKSFFLPSTDGQHGSRALWKKFPEHQEYWQALTNFLEKLN